MQSSYKLYFPGFAAKRGVEHSTSVYGDATTTPTCAACPTSTLALYSASWRSGNYNLCYLEPT